MTTDHLTLHDFMPDGAGNATTEGYIARSGDHITDPDKASKVPVVDIVDALSTVFDPEIPVNIYELGLIYDIEANYYDDLIQLIISESKIINNVFLVIVLHSLELLSPGILLTLANI